mgnify:CR=1 FL=1
MVNTCAIRDNAEAKVWQRLNEFRAHKKQTKSKMVVGVLGKEYIHFQLIIKHYYLIGMPNS